ncbi:hypothetical protein [Rubritalea profundi]|uniref:Uncharacterized protein n=1 Tax=Rubritalea profundi TaxID=1658618 RepID=A0A2S7U166_9BACT|nr:hypothetical protein [Rubritalea profundi]PQJ28237.1 hypothetical protein BSZ32_06775 [Rubritalea profundi]
MFTRTHISRLLVAAFLLLVTPLFSVESQQAPMGLPTRFTDIYIAGEKVEPIPRTDSSSSLVIRVLEIKPASEGYRYDMEVYGLDAGVHSLARFLRFTESQLPVTELETTLEITTQHPIDTLPKPQSLEYSTPGNLSNYRSTIWVAALLWVIVLVCIIVYRKPKPKNLGEEVRVETTHEKLQKLVLATAHGELDLTQKSTLERLIIGHWKKQVPGLDVLPTAEAISQLRTHPEASPLVLKIEHWLHAPSQSITQKEIEPLLTAFKEY